tara:strand:- start:1593 stop:3455 length:1863 start_codon:yes stop_codon:yes gene_type:complete
MMSSSPVTISKFNLQPDTDKELWLIFDIETNGLYDDVTETFCVVCHDIITNQTYKFKPNQINQALQLLSKADVLIGHNILFYDLPVLNKLYDITFNARIIDTLVCTRLIWPKEVLYDLDDNTYHQVPIALKGSASLKAWGYRLSNHKIDFKDFSEYSQEMLDYCVQDVFVTHNLLKYIVQQNYSQPALKLEHEFAIYIQKQIREGIPFDIDAALDLVDVLRTKQTRLEEHLQEIFPPLKHSDWFTPKVNNKKRGYVKGTPFEKIHYERFNPGSRQQIVGRLQEKYGWTPERRTEKGNPILDDEILGKLSYPEAKPLAEYMLIKKRLGQISEGNNAWLKLVNNETGRMHGNVITNGCITSRCSHKSPNLGQVVASYSPYGKECRSLFHPPYDWDQIGIDAKALELRCLAGYLAYWDDGEYAALVVNPEVDIHTYNQEQFGVPTRDIAKRLLYGMLYGCGAVKAGTIIDPNEKDVDKLKTMGRDAINSFLVGVPALRKLKQQVEETISTRGYLIGLDKRALHCRSSFKGLNVLLQSAGALLMKQVVININKNIATNLNLEYGLDWYQMLMIHDEVQLACNPTHTKAIQKESLDAFPQSQEFFGFKCKIEGDSKVGTNWAETH